MIDSSFTNSTGWPDPAHFVTARDLATLTQRIIVDFPEYFHYFAEQTFTYNEIKQSNRNPLLFKDIGADGMKTGHTEESGYGLTATAERNGRRLILVITGLESVRARAAEAERILGWGFRETKNYTLFEGAEEIETADVWLGVEATVPLILPDDLTITMSPRGAQKTRGQGGLGLAGAGADRQGQRDRDPGDFRPPSSPPSNAAAGRCRCRASGLFRAPLGSVDSHGIRRRRPVSRGKFITLEGGEGTGKSTQSVRLARRLKSVASTSFELASPAAPRQRNRSVRCSWMVPTIDGTLLAKLCSIVPRAGLT